MWELQPSVRPSLTDPFSFSIFNIPRPSSPCIGPVCSDGARTAYLSTDPGPAHHHARFSRSTGDSSHSQPRHKRRWLAFRQGKSLRLPISSRAESSLLRHRNCFDSNAIVTVKPAISNTVSNSGSQQSLSSTSTLLANEEPLLWSQQTTPPGLADLRECHQIPAHPASTSKHVAFCVSSSAKPFSTILYSSL